MTRMHRFHFAAVATAAAAALAALAPAAHAQITVVNPSFEDNASAFQSYPGYVNSGSNPSIQGWTSNNTSSGLNGSSTNTGNPFANNGTIPDGNAVAFLQATASAPLTSISQDLSGFVPGQQYTVSFFVNRRLGFDTPNLSVFLGGVQLFSAPITDPSYPLGSYTPVTTNAFTATGATATLTFQNTGSTDSAALIDMVQVKGLASGAAAPEPGALALLAAALPLAGGAALRRRRHVRAPLS